MIRLLEAVLCCECERISDSTGSCCGCGSKSLLNLARVLNRETVEEEFKRVMKVVEASLKV